MKRINMPRMAGGRDMKRSTSQRGPKAASSAYRTVKAPRMPSVKVKWR